MSDGKYSPRHEDSRSSTSDFVKRLYKMLEDQTLQNVVSWRPQRDCFVVKDTNEFTKSILPRIFKHSNFASFVRQLNKYDFHKVKNTDENQFGEHSWTFKHPDFHADRRDALENIKRKGVVQRNSTSSAGAPPSLPLPTPSSSSAYPPPTAYPQSKDSPEAQISSLQTQLTSLGAAHDDVLSHVRSLERSYQAVLIEMVNFQRGMAQQDGLLQIIQHSLPENNGNGEMNQIKPNESMDGGLFMQTQEMQRMLDKSFLGTDVTRAMLVQMSEISCRGEAVSLRLKVLNAPSDNNSNMASTSGANGRMTNLEEKQMLGQQRTASTKSASDEYEDEMTVPAPTNPANMDAVRLEVAADTWSNAGGDSAHTGVKVHTVGHLMPRGSSNFKDAQDSWTFDEAAPSSGSVSESPPQTQTLRPRRSTFVPGWSVSPRVLVVDDDAVSRKLSSKFLQVFGCTFDVAVDGIGAVNKMNLEKYDLVLMDIVMPKLDGVSATSMIRTFDPQTPIISMTSGSSPSEIMTYYSSGMNDILPKPFTKDGLLGILEKHLTHLTVIKKKMSTSMRISRPPTGIPSFNDAGPESTLQAGTASSPEIMDYGLTSSDADDRCLDVLAGMGLTDEQYNIMVAGIVNGEYFNFSEKRSLDLSEEEPDRREGKRRRFEVVE
ncbi:HSF-type DNA-binding-domain-containing protein [Mycena vulgaris]|nr:HSF-type DNA-binding-domain-containing protein [Mycena vulgaris]